MTAPKRDPVGVKTINVDDFVNSLGLAMINGQPFSVRELAELHEVRPIGYVRSKTLFDILGERQDRSMSPMRQVKPSEIRGEMLSGEGGWRYSSKCVGLKPEDIYKDAIEMIERGRVCRGIMLCLLDITEATSAAMSRHSGLNLASITSRLAVMFDAGIVLRRKRRNRVHYYKLSPSIGGGLDLAEIKNQINRINA